MKMPVEVDQLPTVDPIVLDAVAVEHGKSTTAMGRTLRGFGWSPMQVAFAEDKWSWSWMARAVVRERQKRGVGIVAVDVLDKVRAQQADMIQARAEAAWAAEHGETPPPRPPAAAGTPIQLPTKPATTADASAYLPAVEPEPGSQGERL